MSTKSKQDPSSLKIFRPQEISLLEFRGIKIEFLGIKEIFVGAFAQT